MARYRARIEDNVLGGINRTSQGQRPGARVGVEGSVQRGLNQMSQSSKYVRYRTWYSQRPRARDSVLRKCNCMGWNRGQCF